MRTTIQFNTSGDNVNTAFPSLLKAATHTFAETVKITGLILDAGVRAAAVAALVHVNALLSKDETAAASGEAPLMPGLSFWENGRDGQALYFTGEGALLVPKGQSVSLYVSAPNSSGVKVSGTLTIFYEPAA